MLTVACFFTASLNAQVVGGTFDNLADMYELEEWEDCIFKANRLASRSKNENNPELYLYIAMSYHKISKDPDLSQLPEYKKAYDIALKNLMKAKRKDKEGEFFPANNFVVEDILKTGIPMMLECSYQGKYSKALSYLRNFMRITDNQALYYYSGSLAFYNSDKKTGYQVMDSIVPNLKNYVEKAKPEMKPIWADGTKLYFDYLLDDYSIDEAENIIGISTDLFPEDTAILRRSLIDFDALKKEE